MRSVIFSVLLLVLCSASFAQQTPSQVMTPFGQVPGAGGNVIAPKGGPPFVDDSNWETRIFQLRYASLNDIASLIRMFQSKLTTESDLNAIAVRAPRDEMPAIADVIQRFDVAANKQKTIQLTTYMILALPDAENAEAMPAALKPVMDQLRNILNYKSYRVIDTMLTATEIGSGFSVSGVLNPVLTTDANKPSYGMTGRISMNGDAGDPTIRVENINCIIMQAHMPNLEIRATVDIKKGQQIVVGKATVLDRAVILVMSAKVLD